LTAPTYIEPTTFNPESTVKPFPPPITTADPSVGNCDVETEESAPSGCNGAAITPIGNTHKTAEINFFNIFLFSSNPKYVYIMAQFVFLRQDEIAHKKYLREKK
jgi:hypothetical protein